MCRCVDGSEMKSLSLMFNCCPASWNCAMVQLDVGDDNRLPLQGNNGSTYQSRAL